MNYLKLIRNGLKKAPCIFIGGGIIINFLLTNLINYRVTLAQDTYQSEGPQEESESVPASILTLNQKLSLNKPTAIAAEEWQIIQKIFSKRGTPDQYTTRPEVVLPTGETVPLQSKIEMYKDRTLYSQLLQSADSLVLCLVKFPNKPNFNDITKAIQDGVRSYRRLENDISLVGIPLKFFKDEFYQLPMQYLDLYSRSMKLVTQTSRSSQQKYVLLAQGVDKKTLEYYLNRTAYLNSIQCLSSKIAIISATENQIQELSVQNWIQAIFPILSCNTGAEELDFNPEDSRIIVGSKMPLMYDGKGIMLGVLDTGVKGVHRALQGKIFGDVEDYVGHGTHVAGIMVGSTIDGTNFRGIAPGGSVLSINFNIMSPPQAFNYFTENSTGIVNNSWFYVDDFGNPVHLYDGNTLVVDEIIDNQNTDISSAPLLLVFIAGNNGYNGMYSITNPGNAKNVLTVGAVDYTLSGMDGLGKIAFYSSIGPTREGRLKPEIVAPGGNTGPGDTSYLQARNGVVSANAKGSLNYPELDWPGNSDYSRLRGTSMAAPHVTGAAAPLIHYWKSKGWSWNAEDIKAWLINMSIPITQNGTNPLSGYASIQAGYGLLNIYSPINPIPTEISTLLWAHGNLIEEIDVEDEWFIEVPPDVQQLAVTLAYSDEAGSTLHNNLDLILLSPDGETFHHHLPDFVSKESPLEKIIIEQPSAGSWKVTVKFTNWPNDPLYVSSENYSVLGQAIYHKPELEIIPVSTSIEIEEGESFNLMFQLRNKTGFIAAGVNTHVYDPQSVFHFEDNIPVFIGNLNYKNAETAVSIPITAPMKAGNYELIIEANGINKFIEKRSLRIPVTISESLEEKFQVTKVMPYYYQLDTLEVNDKCYIDRLWVLTSLPETLKNFLWIKTADNDAIRSEHKVQFVTNKETLIYLGHDPRIIPPNWLVNKFSKTQQQITINEDGGNSPLELWKANFPAGFIEFGENGAISDPALMYLIALKPSSEVVPTLTARLSMPDDIHTFPGDTFVVPIRLQADDIVNALQFTLDYDSTSVSFLGAQNGANSHGLFITAINSSPNFPPYFPGCNKNLSIAAEGGELPAQIENEIILLKFKVVASNTKISSILFNPEEDQTFLQCGDKTISGWYLSLINSQINIIKNIFTIQGHIQYDRSNESIPSVDVELQTSSEMINASSDDNGYFQFTDLRSGTYNLSFKNGPAVNHAVDETDLGMILNHLGFVYLLQENKIKLSNVNNDAETNGLDAVALLNYITRQDFTELTGSWVYEPPAKQLILLNDINLSISGGILGDINRNWNLLSNFSENMLNTNDESSHSSANKRELVKASIVVEDILASPYLLTKIPIQIKAPRELGMVQFTIEYDSSIIVPATQMFSLEDTNDKFKINLVNKRPNFSSNTSGSFENTVIQLIRTGADAPDSLVVYMHCYGRHPIGTASPVNIDPQPSHSFLVSSFLDMFNGDNLLLDNGSVTISDIDPPREFSLISPTNQSWLATSIPQFRWASSYDNTSGLMEYQLYIDDSLDCILSPSVTLSQPSQSLNDGGHQWYVVAVDSAQKSTRSREIWDFFIDTTPPFSRITYPFQNDTIETTALKIQIIAKDTLSSPASGVKSVEINIDAGLSWPTAFKLDQNGSEWFYDWIDINPGRHHLTCRATDSLNNQIVSQSDIWLTIGDFTGPANFNLIDPISGNWLGSPRPVFTWQKATEVDHYDLWMNDKVMFTYIPSDSNAIQSKDSLADGGYSWYMRAFDSNGNFTISNNTGYFFIDNTAPVSEITYPLSDLFLDNWNGLIKGTAYDNEGAGVSKVEVSIDSGKVWFETNPLDKNFEQWSFNYQYQPPSKIWLVSRATDSLGNIEYPQNYFSIITSLDQTDLTGISEIEIFPSFPNPCSISSPLTFRINAPIREEINLVIFNVRGQIVYQVKNPLQVGRNDIKWQGKNISGLPLAAGIYFAKIRVGKHTRLQKLILLP